MTDQLVSTATKAILLKVLNVLTASSLVCPTVRSAVKMDLLVLVVMQVTP